MAKRKNVHIAPKIRTRLCTLDIFKMVLYGEQPEIYKLDRLTIDGHHNLYATVNHRTEVYRIDSVENCKSTIKDINKRLQEV